MSKGDLARPAMQVNFRNLGGRPLEVWVAYLVAGYVAAGTRALIRASTEERVRSLDQSLWTFDRTSFLPHGTEHIERAEKQPILITTTNTNRNGAEALVLVDHNVAWDESVWRSIDYVFERSDTGARDAARQQWRIWQEQGHEPVYWESDSQGWRRAG